MPLDSQSIRVLIVNDEGLFRDTLAAALRHEDGIVVAGAHACAQGAIAALSREKIDLVLLEHSIIDERLTAVVRWSQEHAPGGRILIVSAALSESDAVWLIGNGVSGIVLQKHSLALLLKALRAVAGGGVWLTQENLKHLTHNMVENRPDPAIRFTNRERLTLKSLLEGHSNKEIASLLDSTESAVKSTVQRLFLKTGVRSRGHLIRISLEKYHELL
jgi:two-component system, NarL family, nitrate/nitrite response regulator NarL